MAQVKERVDVHFLVTNNIIEQLENNIVPWRKPWKDNSIPQNLFLTFNQLKTIGGSVRKGEKGNLIIFWKPIVKAVKENSAVEQELSFVLRYYKVFNVAQCENISPNLLEVSSKIPFSPISYC